MSPRAERDTTVAVTTGTPLMARVPPAAVGGRGREKGREDRDGKVWGFMGAGFAEMWPGRLAGGEGEVLFAAVCC